MHAAMHVAPIAEQMSCSTNVKPRLPVLRTPTSAVRPVWAVWASLSSSHVHLGAVRIQLHTYCIMLSLQQCRSFGEAAPSSTKRPMRLARLVRSRFKSEKQAFPRTPCISQSPTTQAGIRSNRRNRLKTGRRGTPTPVALSPTPPQSKHLVAYAVEPIFLWQTILPLPIELTTHQSGSVPSYRYFFRATAYRCGFCSHLLYAQGTVQMVFGIDAGRHSWHDRDRHDSTHNRGGQTPFNNSKQTETDPLACIHGIAEFYCTVLCIAFERVLSLFCGPKVPSLRHLQTTLRRQLLLLLLPLLHRRLPFALPAR
jgi:hypothetical protein